ncbi:MAG: 4Fe-4S binding protein [Tannerellaceae bacterium]|nr:4Fe-4S binding protein [Tannerellaceae bacterium]
MEREIKRLEKICTPYLWINPRICQACWKCVDACPQQVIGKVGFLWHKHIVIRNRDNCIGCKKCFNACEYHVFNEI